MTSLGMMTVKEAAAALHVSVSKKSIYAAIRENRLEALMIGGRYLISPEALERFACHGKRNRRASTKGQMTAAGSSATAPSPKTQSVSQRSALRLLRKPKQN
ncbi:MAG: helix-turn-helix domain-containing protein [Pseudomonadota bacterium]